MIPLPPVLKKHGFTYTLVRREGRFAIYEQRVYKNTKAYEVFIIRIKPEKYLPEKTIPSKESFPSDEDFGKTAWSCKTLNKAKQKFWNLSKRNVWRRSNGNANK